MLTTLLIIQAVAAPLWSEAQVVGQIEAVSLDELSGLTSSGVIPDLLWGINDSPDPVLFAIDSSGDDLDRLSVEGVENYDWEDLSGGPCPDFVGACACLYIADSGDDDASRENGRILILPEPEAGSFSSNTEAPMQIWYTTSSGLVDVEAMVVDPDTLDIFLFEKTTEPLSSVFRISGPHLPSSNESPTMAVNVASVDLTSAVDRSIGAATISPNGRLLAIRTDSDLLLYEGDEGVIEMLNRAPASIPTVVDPHGEAASFSFDGTAIYLSGEGNNSNISAVFADPAEPQNRVTEECELTSTCGCSTSNNGAKRLLISIITMFGLLLFRRKNWDYSSTATGFNKA